VHRDHVLKENCTRYDVLTRDRAGAVAEAFSPTPAHGPIRPLEFILSSYSTLAMTLARRSFGSVFIGGGAEKTSRSEGTERHQTKARAA
jgi:hypothetical protein